MPIIDSNYTDQDQHVYAKSQNPNDRPDTAQSMKKSLVGDTICDTPGDSIMDRVIKFSENDSDQVDLVTRIDG